MLISTDERLFNQSINQSIDQSVNQSVNQSINQSINRLSSSSSRTVICQMLMRRMSMINQRMANWWLSHNYAGCQLTMTLDCCHTHVYLISQRMVHSVCTAMALALWSSLMGPVHFVYLCVCVCVPTNITHQPGKLSTGTNRQNSTWGGNGIPNLHCVPC